MSEKKNNQTFRKFVKTTETSSIAHIQNVRAKLFENPPRRVRVLCFASSPHSQKK